MAHLGDGLNGYLDVENATLRAPRLEAVSNIGIANTSPEHAFSVGSNLYVSINSPDVLTVNGNVVCEGIKVGFIEILPSYDLAAVSNVGNVTQSTIQFANTTTAFVTTANVEVGTANLFVDTTTSRVGVNTATPDASLHVTGNAYVSSNLEVGTANLFVDTVNSRVGIGTTNPHNILEVRGGDGTESDTHATFGKAVADSAGWSGIRLGTPYAAAHDAYCSVIESYNNPTSNYASILRFKTSLGDNAVATEHMRIDSVGSVGIGTDAPTRKLHVAGDGQTATGGVIHAHLDETGGAPYESNAFSMNMGGYSHSIRMDLNTLSLNAYGDAGRYGAMKFVVGDGSGSGSGQITAMMLQSGGNVGIGTNAPDYKLKIEQGFSNNSNGLFISNSNYGSMQGLNLSMVNAGDSYFNSYAAIQTYTSGVAAAATNLVLNPTAGNVGIGVASPVAFLDVAGSSDSGKSLQLRSGDSSTHTDSSQIIFSFNGNPYNAAGYAHSIRTRHNSASDTDNAIDFWLWNTTDTTDENTLGNKRVMTIDGTGFVGIGTTSPVAKLHIHGDLPQLRLSVAAANNPSWSFQGSGAASEAMDLKYRRDDGAESRLFLVGGEHAADAYKGWTFNTHNGTNALRIDKDANVGIGTASPAVKLDFGSVVANRIINLYGTGGDSTTTAYYGFGINSSTLRYNTSGTGDVHKFYGGTTEYGYVNDATGFVNSFTGQHKSFPHESLSGKTVDELSGLIVCASGEHISVNDAIPQRGQDGITVSEAIPSVKLSVTENEKTVFGVVSNVEDPESTEREDKSGAFTSTFKKIVGDTRIYVNSLGEGAVWVCNTNGSLVNGDYITTSNVAGYGQKQDSDTLKNYTVAKITMDCDFRGTLVPKKQIKKKFVTETFEETVEETVEDNMPEDVYTYDVDRECYVKTVKDNIKTQTRSVMQEYELRDSDGNVITETISKTISTKEYEILVNKEGCVANISGYQNEDGTITVEEYSTLEDRTGYSEIIDNYTQTINQPVTYSGKKIIVKTVTHEVDDLDEHGNLQWEDHPTETETAYKIRYLDADGNITDEANHVYKAAFVGCTYHCG